MKNVKDPVCGMIIKKSMAEAKYTYNGEIFYFCNKTCYEKIKKEPEKYLKRKEEKEAPIKQKQMSHSPTESVKLKIEGITCAACVATIERTLKKEKGVVKANVNLATEEATISYMPDVIQTEDLIKVVEISGYRVLKDKEDIPMKEAKVAKKRLTILLPYPSQYSDYFIPSLLKHLWHFPLSML
ncbi:MAG: hypothetical protein B5M53_06490 [Candidatus Cloacimonas sp. 4484_209]|nr:MAG: hypothetical protein B5M53_06490 [Candidatus Cloacimonas sp. 4484_209]